MHGLQRIFKAAERQHNDYSLDGKRFEGLRASKGSSSIRKALGYKPRIYQKDLRKRQRPENSKTGTRKENFILHCVQDSHKGEKNLKRSRKPLLSAAMVHERLERSTRLILMLSSTTG